MAAVSFGKLGKLDAICSRLKLTQQVNADDGVGGCTTTEIGANYERGSNGNPGSDGEADVTKKETNGGLSPGKKGEGLTNGNGTKVVGECQLESKECSAVKCIIDNGSESVSSGNTESSNNNNSLTVDYNKEIRHVQDVQDKNSNNVCLSEQVVSSTTIVESNMVDDFDKAISATNTSLSSGESGAQGDLPNGTDKAVLLSEESRTVKSLNAQISSSPSSSHRPSSPSSLSSLSMKPSCHQENKETTANGLSVSGGNKSENIPVQNGDKSGCTDKVEPINDYSICEENVTECGTVTLPSTELNESQSSGMTSLPKGDYSKEPAVVDINATTPHVQITDDNDHNKDVNKQKETSVQQQSSVINGEIADELKNYATPKTIPDSDSTPSTSSRAMESVSGPSDTSNAGRRKSRKATKPQKQIGGRYVEQTRLFSTESIIDDQSARLEFEGQDGYREERDIDDRVPTSLKADAPLDLSSLTHTKGNLDSTRCIPQQSVTRQSDKQSSSSSSSSRKRGIPSKVASNVPSTLPENSNSYANTLVDYAKNTMSELLGIYGFEGSDTKNFHLGKMFNFPDNIKSRLSESNGGLKQEGADEGGLEIVIDGESLGHAPSPSAVAAAVKSGPFRKKVYTSLTHPNIGNGQNGDIIKAPSPPLSSPVVPTTTSSKSSGSGASTQSSQAKGNSSTHTKRHYAVKTFSSSDFHKYIRRYGSGLDCGGEHCHDLGYRDHYHCLDCPTKVFIRKEEMVRHFKWHKKRQDSLQHGFMRYSPVDDCSKKYGSCTHNGRQTHYHCVQRGCDKVYISTSDVQMHANFHRKDSAIIQEGFQRFRATEDCGTTYCAFYGQRTTHFHCRRPQCNFTFKHKSDMEKHKSYHQKDEVLSKDGFKKFMKYEPCPFTGCRHSKVSNHIHCIRPGCQYVLHSTAQLYSHKRKHERREFETAYQKYSHIRQRNTPTGSSLSSSTSPPSSFLTMGERNGGHIGTKSNMLTLSEMLANPPLPLPIKMNVKAEAEEPMGCVSHKTSMPLNGKARQVELTSETEISLGHNMSALNLSKKRDTGASVVDSSSNYSSDDERQTMALSLDELKFEEEANTDYEEAEDLSLSSKRWASQCEKTKQVNIRKAVIKFEPGTEDMERFHSTENPSDIEMIRHKNSVENMSVYDEQPNDDDDDEDDDDEDDDDDDDKDYTQEEEPTLVNGFRGLLEEEKFDTSSMASTSFETKADMAEHMTDESDKEEVDEISGKPDSSQRHLAYQGHRMTREIIQQLQSSSGQSLSVPHVISTAKGQILGLRIPPKLSPEKKERDESWKKYLIRYTANDACFSRCSSLYKDHYHCRVDSCQVTFKSKDGVRGHARFHALQDSITPLVYFKFDETTSCKHENCPYSKKELHYHCNWSNCKQIIPHSGPTFALLEHYRIHEFGRVYSSKTKASTSSQAEENHLELDPLQKRRGRPPKYPRYDRPVVPKVHLTEKEILDSTLAFLHNKFSEHSTIINGFKKFEATESCPDKNCIFNGSKHFHCGRKFCHMSTDRLDFLNLHAKDFHNNITILDGYEFFERVVDCRRPHCHNNRINRHFHCVRPRCDYSFVRHSTMSQHNKKHPTATAAVLLTPQSSTSQTQLPNKLTKSSNKPTTPQYVPIAPAAPKTPSPSKMVSPLLSPPLSTAKMKHPIVTIDSSNPHDECIKSGDSNAPEGKTVVKSAGTFFPLSGIPNVQLTPTMSQVIAQQQMINKSISPQNASPSSKTQQSGDSPTPPSASAVLKQNPNTRILQSSPPAAIEATTRVVHKGQIITTPAGTQMVKPVVGMSIPANMVPASIPVLAQTSQGQQQSILTGIIPVSNITHPTTAVPQMVNIPGAHIISTSQGQFLQTGVISNNMVHVIQNPMTLTTSSTTGNPSVVSTSGYTPATMPTNAPLTILLHQPGNSSPLSWANLKKRMHYPIEANCGRPFCKLKKKDHYHCLDCNQAFSDHARLRVHIGKHGFKFKKSDQNGKMDDNSAGFTYVPTQGVESTVKHAKTSKKKQNIDHAEEDKLSSSLNLQLSVFTDMVAKGKEVEAKEAKSKSSPQNEKITLVMSNVNSQWTIGKGEGKVDGNSSTCNGDGKEKVEDGVYSINVNDDDEQPSLMIDDEVDESNESSLNDSSSSLTLCSSLSRKSGRKRSLVQDKDFVNSDTLVIPKAPKQRKVSGKRDSDLPPGYKRVRCGEDCGHIRCSYRQTVTHFHCLRKDCGYGFSDKSRIMQHTIRHERLDKLMGGEFQQFRASVSCERSDCEFDEKASHFHCLKCSFACTDSSKVPPHRKYHTKLENISSNGFIKYGGTADCQIASCSYFRKQTHYHCSFPGCNHSVLGPSQMAPHKLKHS